MFFGSSTPSGFRAKWLACRISIAKSKPKSRTSPPSPHRIRPCSSLLSGQKRGRRLGTSAPPYATFNPEPTFPDSQLSFQNSSPCLVSNSRQAGQTARCRVRESGGQDFDCIAMPRVRTWRFKPAPCDGEPIPAEINVAIYFRRNEHTKNRIPDFCNLQLATGLPSFKRVLSLQLLHRFPPDTLESLGLSQ